MRHIIKEYDLKKFIFNSILASGPAFSGTKTLKLVCSPVLNKIGYHILTSEDGDVFQTTHLSTAIEAYNKY